MLTSVKIGNMMPPLGDHFAAKLTIDWTTNASQDFDLISEQLSEGINFVQSAYVNNRQNPNLVRFTIGGTEMVLPVAPFSVGVYPIIAPFAGFRMTANIAAPAAFQTSIIFLNVPMAYFVWTPGA